MEMVNSSIDAKDLEILKDIEEKILKHIDLGFDPHVLETLDRDDVTKKEIEPLKEKLGKAVVLRLYNLGNSFYFGRLRAGRFSDFSEIIFRLGMRPTKIYILSLALFFLHPSKEFTNLAARSFMISILSKTLARYLGHGEDEVKKVELGGLFLKVGKVIMLLYERKIGTKLEDRFVSKYYPFLGERIVEKFKLPEFLKEMISTEVFRLNERLISLPSLIDLAHNAVDKSFKRYGKFVLETPMPDSEGLVVVTDGSIISAQMEALGLSEYLEIIPTLTARQALHQARAKIATADAAPDRPAHSTAS